MFGGQRSLERTTCTIFVSQQKTDVCPRASHHIDFPYLLAFWNTRYFSQATLQLLECVTLFEAALSTMKMVFHLHLWWLTKLDTCE